MKNTKAILLVLAVFTGLAQVQAGTPREKTERIDSYYQEILKEYEIAGSSLRIYADGELQLQASAGMANIEAERFVDERSIFHWASITKTFTGIAIMQLRDRGLLDLADPVSLYLPEIREIHNPYGSNDDITIYHLLTHSSGLRGPTWPWKTEDWHPYEPSSWKQLVAMFPYSKVSFKPGTAWQYSNLGIVMLGMIIEGITTEDYEYYVDKNILKPLGMFDTFFDLAPPHLLDDLCMSYWISGEGGYLPAIFNLNTGITVSNGGLNGTMTDMGKYLNFLLGFADEKTYYFVLSRSSLDEMLTPQMVIPDSKPLGAESESQCLAFFMEKINGKNVFGHSGNQNGFHSHLYICPETKFGYIVAYNSVGRGNRRMDAELKVMILENYLEENDG
jgi:CubicO group peptidase (beta-lactamase class C family)